MFLLGLNKVIFLLCKNKTNIKSLSVKSKY